MLKLLQSFLLTKTFYRVFSHGGFLLCRYKYGVATVSRIDKMIEVSFAKEPYKREDILQKRPNFFIDPTDCSHLILLFGGYRGEGGGGIPFGPALVAVMYILQKINKRKRVCNPTARWCMLEYIHKYDCDGILRRDMMTNIHVYKRDGTYIKVDRM